MHRLGMMLKKSFKNLIYLLAVGLCLMAKPGFADEGMWQLVHSQKNGLAHRSATALPDLPLMPDQFQLYRVDESAMQSSLSAVDATIQITVPMPDGQMVDLLLKKSSMLEQALAEQRPDIMTFGAVAISDPGIYGTLDFSPKGFHGLLSTPDGMVYIDPRGEPADRYYISYYQKDYHPNEKTVAASCGVDPSLHHQDKEAPSLSLRFARQLAAAFTTGDRLHEYRLAVATTAEYTTFHANSTATAKDDALDAIVTTINRVNFFLKRDFSAKLNLVADNRDIIFTDAATDGLSNGSTNTLLGQVQPIIDDLIGFNNYDVGHVFHTTSQFSSSGIAYVGIICDPRTQPFQGENRKAQGVSGSWRPVGDAFDVELVAHEIGHQFGAGHTFNSTRGTCSGARDGGSAVEPGSGSTLMSYPGSCGTDNLQSGPDYMFSSTSMEEVAEEFENGWGNLCDVATDEGNNEPGAIASGTYEIPAHTPFELTGAGVDPDSGDVLTYSWEQTDSGSSSRVDVDTGDNAIFRAFLPVDTATRIFPRLPSILSGSSSLGETLPTTTRQLNFRLTVRDQRGGTDDANVVVNVTDTDTSNNGFRITSFNTGQELVAGSSVNFTWNKVDTDLAPINCSNVSISFSSDGGQTFPIVVDAAATNDGSVGITVPGVITSQGRFKLQCADNIFFDISDANLAIGNAPEIRINGNGQEIDDGATGVSLADNTSFGSTSLVSGTLGMIDKTFQIQNLGTEPLQINGNPRVEISGSGSDDFSVTDFPASSISASGNDTFTIRFSRATAGTSNATVQILSNDGDESPYTFAIRGVAEAPEINISGNNSDIPDGDSAPDLSDNTDFGGVSVGANKDNVFNIANTSIGLLELTGSPRIVISGSHASDFSVQENADQFTDISTNNNNFSIRFTPSDSGVRNASISIANNDIDENPYNFSVRGTGLAADLSPTMLDNPDPVNPGEILQYMITVNNAGPSAAQGVVATFNKASQISIESTAGCNGSPAASSTCALGSIPVNGSKQFTVNTLVGTAARNSVSSSVSIAAQTPDVVAGNNSDSESTTVTLVPPLFSISATPSEVLQNERSTIRLLIDNTVSNVAASSLGVNLNLPDGLVIAGPTNTGSTCSGSLVATPGETQMNFASGAVSASQSCAVSLDVVASEQGGYALQTSELTSSSGNSGSASVQLSVVEKLDEGICFPVKAANGNTALICL